MTQELVSRGFRPTRRICYVPNIMDVGGWPSFDGVDFNKSSCPSTVRKSKVFINLLIRKD